MVVNNDSNGNYTKVPNGVIWGIVVAVVLTPIGIIGGRQFGIKVDIVRHEEILKSVKDNVNELKNDFKDVVNKLDKLYRANKENNNNNN